MSNQLLYGLSNSIVKVASTEDKHVVATFTLSDACPIVSQIECSPSASVAVISAASRDRSMSELICWNYQQKKVEKRFEVDPMTSITCMAFNHNGNLFVTGGYDGMVRVFDMVQQTCVLGWKVHGTPVAGVQFSKGETSIVSIGTDGRMMEKGLHSYTITDSLFEFDPVPVELEDTYRPRIRFDGNMDFMITTSPMGKLNIYHIPSTRLVYSVSVHEGPVLNVDWILHASHMVLVSSGIDQTVRVTEVGWSESTGASGDSSN